MTINKGMLVYVPAGVRLYRSEKDAKEYDIYIKEYKVTEKPVNCLVVGVSKKQPSSYKIIFEGGAWSVSSSDIYQINKETSDVSYSS